MNVYFTEKGCYNINFMEIGNPMDLSQPEQKYKAVHVAFANHTFLGTWNII